jgi:hypothetical protein
MIPDVHLPRPRRTQRRQLAILQEAQDLDLRLGRHLADLVEEQRAALGLLDQPRLGLMGGRVRAGAVAEQLALDQLARDGGAVDRHELPLALARLVHRARVDLLADAGLADDEQLALRRGQPAQTVARHRQRRRRGRHRSQRRDQLGLDRLELDLGHHPEHADVIADEHQRAVAQPLPALRAQVVDERAVLAAEILQVVAARADARCARAGSRPTRRPAPRRWPARAAPRRAGRGRARRRRCEGARAPPARA